MKDIAEANSNSSVFEEETSDELSFEELESVAGGGIAKDAGHLAGDIVSAPIKAIGDFASGFWKGLWD